MYELFIYLFSIYDPLRPKSFFQGSLASTQHNITFAPVLNFRTEFELSVELGFNIQQCYSV